MGNFNRVVAVPQKFGEQLHISKTSGHIKANLRVYRYIDKDTNHHMAYIPSLELSGYGNNKKEAFTMLNDCLDSYFEFIMSLPDKKLQPELSKFGWVHDKLKNKDYSKAFVDISGNLKDFAVEDTIEQELVTV